MRLVLALFLVAACGGEGTPVDARGGPEVTPHPGSDIGDPCALAGGACGGDQGTCTGAGDICIAPICDPLFVGGYCSQKCGPENPGHTCPSDSTCVANGQQASSLTYRCLRKCQTDADCRPNGYVCLPVTEGGKVCAPGLGCATAPPDLQSPDFQHPNLRVPSDPVSLFEAEGNCASDGMGHLAMSQIAIYGGFAGDGMAVATYDEAGAMFGGMVQVFKDLNANSVETSDPVVAYDRTGGNPAPLYVTWLEVGSTNPHYVYVSKSLDHGATWSTPLAVSGTDGRNNFLDKPWIAAANGKVWVTWMFPGAIRFAYSQDAGATFGTPGTAALMAVGNFAQLAAADSGDTYLSWGVNETTAGIHVARWNAQTSRFADERPVPNSDRAVYDPIANGVSPDGTHFYVAFASGAFGERTQILVSACSDANGAFTIGSAVQVNDHPECGVRIHPTIAVDSRGRGHVMWLDSYYTGGVARYSMSDPLGQTWTAPVVASDAPPWPFTVTRIPGLWLGDYVGIAVDPDRVWVYYNGTQVGDRTHFFLTWRALEP